MEIPVDAHVRPRGGAARRTAAQIAKDFRNHRMVYAMAAPVLLFYLLFHYGPMYGALMAFKDFSSAAGIWGSRWVGFKHFESFFSSYYFFRILGNTIRISAYTILWGFPAPLLLALLLNEIRTAWFKQVVQTITYLPHFISLVVICSLIINFTSTNGIATQIVAALGGPKRNLLMESGNFTAIYVVTEIWQHLGWNAIIYLAALAAIDQELYEAAKLDGAGRLRQTFAITLPSILPTIIVLLILRMGRVMDVGFEKIILLYNPAIYESADVISSFVYRRGLVGFDYSYSAAVGLFNSAVNFTLVVCANKLGRSVNETGLW
jgi:putative aldouronate transport system permease protein